METRDFKILINKYLSGDASRKEAQVLDEFFDLHKADNEPWDSELLGEKEQFRQNLFQNIQGEVHKKAIQDNQRTLWPSFLRIAASVALLLTIGWVVYMTQTSEAELIWTAKATQAGEKLTVQLSDGTVVKLNADSRLEFPESFGSDERGVKLIGEAYFDVARDTERPFTIETGEIVTTVLGTSFNVAAYPEEAEIAVAVVTGKVQVESFSKINQDMEDTELVHLTPNKQAVFIRESKELLVTPFDMEQAIGWKEGIIVFQSASEKEVMEQLERWYGVTIQVGTSGNRDWDLTARFNNQSLEEVLTSLSHTASFEFEIDQKDVVINYR